MRRRVCLRARINPYTPRRWLRRLFPIQNSARRHAKRARFFRAVSRHTRLQFGRTSLPKLCWRGNIFSLQFRKRRIWLHAVFRWHTPNPTIGFQAAPNARRHIGALRLNRARQRVWRVELNRAGRQALARAFPPFWLPTRARRNFDSRASGLLAGRWQGSGWCFRCCPIRACRIRWRGWRRRGKAVRANRGCRRIASRRCSAAFAVRFCSLFCLRRLRQPETLPARLRASLSVCCRLQNTARRHRWRPTRFARIGRKAGRIRFARRQVPLAARAAILHRLTQNRANRAPIWFAARGWAWQILAIV